MPLITDNPEPKSDPILPEIPLLQKQMPVSFGQIDGLWVPITVIVPDTDAATAVKYGVFFTADFNCEFIEAIERHKTAGTDASAVTLDIEKLTSGTAPGSGVSVLVGTFNLKSTVNTPVRKTGVLNNANKVLKPGDALALKTAGTLTAVNQVSVTVYLRPIYSKIQNI